MKIKTTLTALALGAGLAVSANGQTLFTLANTDDMSLSHTTSSPLASNSVDLTNGTFSWGTLLTDTTANTAVFSSGVFSSSDWGGDGTFTSNAIDVSSFTAVDIVATGSSNFNSAPTEFFNFFYTLDGGSENIFSTNIDALDVTGINSLVVGFAYNHNGGSDNANVSALSVTAVPEPNAYALIASLFALTVVMVRRRGK
jgi:trimeric autotransporter adhesin